MSKTNRSNSFLTIIFFLCFLTIVNIVFFNIHGRSIASKCSTDTVLHVAALYITNGRANSIQDHLPDGCPVPSKSTQAQLDGSVRELIKLCEAQGQAAKRRHVETPLITLFTTHAAHNHKDEEKQTVHTNTIQNWASFKPYIQAVLFTNETAAAKIARVAGWDVLPLGFNNYTQNTTNTEFPPILKNMFTTILNNYKNTPLYGYVNADILFSDNFIDTLLFITYHFNTNESIFITGQRINVENATHFDVSSKKNIQHIAETNGTLFRIDAEDFFITTNLFPWHEILPVVVGRPGYDNWLVSYARCQTNATVIDVTESLTAFHQTTKLGGNQEGHLHSIVNYNYDVFKQNKIKPDFTAGLTPCAEYRTYINLCDTVGIVKRTANDKGCLCNKNV